MKIYLLLLVLCLSSTARTEDKSDGTFAAIYYFNSKASSSVLVLLSKSSSGLFDVPYVYSHVGAKVDVITAERTTVKGISYPKILVRLDMSRRSFTVMPTSEGLAVVLLGEDGSVLSPFEGKVYVQMTDIGGTVIAPDVNMECLAAIRAVNDSFENYKQAVKMLMDSLPEKDRHAGGLRQNVLP